MAAAVDLFGQTAAGDAVHLVRLQLGELRVELLTLGLALRDVRLVGVDHGLTVGARDLTTYDGELFHLGTLMGPVANRIENAEALIDGITHKFDANFLDRHTLHGGRAATHAKVWTLEDATQSTARMSVDLPHGEGGFPGDRRIVAKWMLKAPATLELVLSAESNAPTLMNLANHSYWNLGPEPTIRGHELTIHADRFLPSDAHTTLPLGPVSDVQGTRFDYRGGRWLSAGDEGLLDTNFCLAPSRRELTHVAKLVGPTGVVMDMSTTEPGLQIFDGHMLGATGASGLDGLPIHNYSGLALEAQFWPNAPHHRDYPSILLNSGDEWCQITRWQFSQAPGRLAPVV